jgi:hypothetical protein
LKIVTLLRKYKILNKKIKKEKDPFKFLPWTLKRYKNNMSLIYNKKSLWINNKIKRSNRVILIRERCLILKMINHLKNYRKCRSLLAKLWIKNNKLTKKILTRANSISKLIYKHFRLKKKERILKSKEGWVLLLI